MWSVHYNKQKTRCARFPGAIPVQSEKFIFSTNFDFEYYLSHHEYLHDIASPPCAG
jgi:hypothetical protein